MFSNYPSKDRSFYLTCFEHRIEDKTFIGTIQVAQQYQFSVFHIVINKMKKDYSKYP